MIGGMIANTNEYQDAMAEGGPAAGLPQCASDISLSQKTESV